MTRRRRTDVHTLDLPNWPTVDLTALNEAARPYFLKAQAAIELYAQNESIDAIVQRTGVDRRQMYRLIARCLCVHDDGRLFGFRGLIRHSRVMQYQRGALTHTLAEAKPQGLAGAFTKLLSDYPALAAWLRDELQQRRVVVEQRSTGGHIAIRIRGLKQAHERFLQRCRACGIAASDYPFHTARLAIRSLSAALKNETLGRGGAACDSLEQRAGSSRRDRAPSPVPAAEYPLQVVEFDGHRLDMRLALVIQDPLGYEQRFEVERGWLLVILDVCSRCVLGYHLCLEAEYSRHDVLKTIENALRPRGRPQITVEGLAYMKDATLPSTAFPELGYAVWQWIKLDNAKANLAVETRQALCEFIGCFLDAGPAHQPNERPYIERFFGTLASTMSSRAAWLYGFPSARPATSAG